MSRNLDEEIRQDALDPVRRAKTLAYLEIIGDTDPVEAAYLRATLAGDVKTVRKMLLYRQLYRVKNAAKTDPLEAEYLAYLVKEIRKLEA